MITVDKIKKYKKDELIDVADSLDKQDTKQLIEWLNEKDDKLRYPSLLLLQLRSKEHDDVYPYWDELASKLKSDNSYQRSIGVMLISENIKWDKDNKFKNIIDYYLTFCNDEKLVTARQCIQGLSKVVEATDYDADICNKIVKELTSIDIKKRPNTNWKVMTTDIVNILMNIAKERNYKEIIIYFNKVLEDNIVDSKLKNEIKELLN